jgi:putative membrane protein
MPMLLLWLKAFHVVFVVTWFAGLFYLPRLFVYHAEAAEPVLRERFKVMERRLLGITHIGAALAVAFGVATMAWWMLHDPAYLRVAAWFHVKMALVLLLIAYHAMLVRLTRAFARDACRWSSLQLRLFNEIPAVLLVAIVILVIVKPF